MAESLHFTGFIRGVKYNARLAETRIERDPKKVDFAVFNVNTADSYGVIRFLDTEIAYSKWVSPKRTRSYPFARIYSTYNASKILTIIPVIKDEGKDGDLDRIQYSTISWMNLLNVYIVLGYYDIAEKNINKTQINREKLTNQKFNNQFVKSQIQEIFAYKQSALHWNRNLFEDRFVDIFRRSLAAYINISNLTNVKIHSQKKIEEYLQKITNDFEEFKNISLRGSLSASNREIATSHKFEYLNTGIKASLYIENYLGGIYHLTIDEVMYEEGIYILQESKNSTKKSLPEISDIQDGLFKLILYSNIDSLFLNGEKVEFITRLKLTGKNIKENITLPCRLDQLRDFFVNNINILSEQEMSTIRQLLLESTSNQNIRVEIGANN